MCDLFCGSNSAVFGLKISGNHLCDVIRTSWLLGEEDDDKSVIVEKGNAIKVLNLEYSKST